MDSELKPSRFGIGGVIEKEEDKESKGYLDQGRYPSRDRVKAEPTTKFGKVKKNRKGTTITECVVEDGLGNILSVPVKIKINDHLYSAAKYPYNPLTCELIAREIASGKTIKKISQTPGFPPKGTIDYWLRQHPEFKKLIRQARAQRAEYFHDMIVEVAEDVDEDTAKSARVKLDAYKHLAAVNDPDTYGDRIKHTGDPEAPIGFIVDTGIRRGSDGDEDEQTE